MGPLYATRQDGRRAMKKCFRIGEVDMATTLFRAVADGRLAVYMAADPIMQVPLTELAALGMPVLVTVVDTGLAVGGPASWPQTSALVEWAGSMAPSCANGRPYFQAIVEETVTLGRLLVIETRPELMNAWRRAGGGQAVPLVEA